MYGLLSPFSCLINKTRFKRLKIELEAGYSGRHTKILFKLFHKWSETLGLFVMNYGRSLFCPKTDFKNSHEKAGQGEHAAPARRLLNQAIKPF